MPVWLSAGLWALFAGGALVLGAAIAWFLNVPRLVVALVMAFGSGVLISALAFDLVGQAEKQGGLVAAAGGFFGGAAVYVAANRILDQYGAKHRKRSGDQQPGPQQNGSGAAIALGALLDGIPESVVLGLSLLGGGSIGVSVLAAVFISNIPEGLSSSAGMKKNGRSATYVFGVWIGIAVLSGLAALIGVLVLQGASPQLLAVITSVAAGAILAMIADTMIPEAFERTHGLTGLVTVIGFLAAFVLQRA